MRRPLVLLFAVVTAACGHKIGDSCNVSTDCAQDGTRVCDTFSPGGSCTIQGCDFGTCPDEATCVRFYPALENAPECDMQDDCAVDEVCFGVALPGENPPPQGKCAPRSIEQRFCMLTCSDNSDCRDGYECRTRALQRLHGGEPVPDPTASSSVPSSTKFCGPRRSCSLQTDCTGGDICDPDTHVCVPM